MRQKFTNLSYEIKKKLQEKEDEGKNNNLVHDMNFYETFSRGTFLALLSLQNNVSCIKAFPLNLCMVRANEEESYGKNKKLIY